MVALSEMLAIRLWPFLEVGEPIAPVPGRLPFLERDFARFSDEIIGLMPLFCTVEQVC